MSDKRKFREFAPVRSPNVPKYKNYQSYKEYLKKDFHGRCVYCNVPEMGITDMAFTADHFIPRKVYEDIDGSLETEYENLMFACSICNNAKGDQYMGAFPADKRHNLYFYHPFEVDYNDVFYRDENGMIQSDDPLGREMILRLKLYHPCHALEYIVERIEKEIDKLTGILKQPEGNRDMPSKEKLERARLLLCLEYTERFRSLRKTYKQKLATNSYENMG